MLTQWQLKVIHCKSLCCNGFCIGSILLSIIACFSHTEAWKNSVPDLSGLVRFAKSIGRIWIFSLFYDTVARFFPPLGRAGQVKLYMYALKFHSIPYLLSSLRGHSDTIPVGCYIHSSLNRIIFPFLFGDQAKRLACSNEKLWGEKDVHKEA